MLKLALSKNLALLEEQNFENDQARISLQQFIDGISKSLQVQSNDVDRLIDNNINLPPDFAL